MRYNISALRASVATLALTPALAMAEVPRVVTDIPVTHALVSMVMGDLGTPEVLLDQGGDPHHVQLRPSQARALAQAGLAIWIADDLTPWMASALGGLSSGARLELIETPGLTLQGFQPTRLTRTAQHGHDDHGHDDHGHGNHGHDDHGHDDHGHDDHGHGDVDPHAWLDPENATLWLAAIATALGELDPANADTYRANANAGMDRVMALRDEMAQILAPVGDAGLVMYHDAYGYLARAFGLNVLGTIALGSAADPGAARLAEIRATLDQAGAVCVFPEVNHPDAYVALISDRASVRVGAPLDPAGTMLDPGHALYETLMRGLAQGIADCVAG